MKNKRGPKTKDFLVTKIILLKRDSISVGKELTAGDIRSKLLEQHPRSKAVPKASAIYKILERNKDKIVPSDLDKPWSLGSCLKYDMAPDVIIPLQQQLLPYGLFLTTRRARWYSKLYPILSPALECFYPGDNLNQLRLMQIASFYTRTEQIAEINGESHPDTRALDDIYIFNRDVSFETKLPVWLDMYIRPPEKTKTKGEAVPIERILGNITEAETKLLNKFIVLLARYDAGEVNIEKLLSFTKDNSNIQPLIEKWMVLSLRRDIQINVKAVKQNER